MRHPVEIFDTAQLRLMAEALQAAIATVRLTGAAPSAEVQTGMARRLVQEARAGGDTRLALSEAALDGPW